MILDKFSRPIFDSEELFEIAYEQGITFFDKIVAKKDLEIQKFNENNHHIILTEEQLEDFDSINSFDIHHQEIWMIPPEYKNFDIESYLVNKCPRENYQRLTDELQEYRNRSMLDLLRWLKYLVDTCRNNNIVWGVGRGSSVASYVLYLLEVHKIDSVKYNLDWREFLR